jgi:hypothetical protein
VLGDLPSRRSLAAALRVFFSGISYLPCERANAALLVQASTACQHIDAMAVCARA